MLDEQEMTRKEFLKISWQRYIKPVVIGMLLVISTNILLEAISTVGSERTLIVAIIILASIVIIIMLLNLISILLTEWIKSKLPESLNYAMSHTKKVIRYLSLFASVWLLWELYQRENFIGIVITIWFLIQEIAQLKEQAKTKSI